MHAALFIKTSFKQHVRLILSSFSLQAASSAHTFVCVCVCVHLRVCMCVGGCEGMSADGKHTLASNASGSPVVSMYTRRNAGGKPCSPECKQAEILCARCLVAAHPLSCLRCSRCSALLISLICPLDVLIHLDKRTERRFRCTETGGRVEFISFPDSCYF